MNKDGQDGYHFSYCLPLESNHTGNKLQKPEDEIWYPRSLTLQDLVQIHGINSQEEEHHS